MGQGEIEDNEQSGSQGEIASIWEKFRKDDKKALATLFELTSNRLYRYGTKFVVDEELVKDCIQELFIKLLQNQKNLPYLTNPVFYLFRALKNILINAIQEREKIVYFSPQEIPFHVTFYYQKEDESDLSEDIKDKFEKVINLLSDRQKEAIYLRFSAEMSYDEISELLGINYQSARNLIHRSIDKIRSEIGSALLSIFLLSLY